MNFNQRPPFTPPSPFMPRYFTPPPMHGINRHPGNFAPFDNFAQEPYLPYENFPSQHRGFYNNNGNYNRFNNFQNKKKFAPRNFSPLQQPASNKNNKFIDFCDTCDRGFSSIELKNEHYSQHVKCNIRGCKFEAHFKIVKIHKSTFHGKYESRLKLDSEEEIAKWREERRKNFPTAENIAKKKLQQKEREISGNILETKKFGNRKRPSNNFQKAKQFRKSSESPNEAIDGIAPNLLFSPPRATTNCDQTITSESNASIDNVASNEQVKLSTVTNAFSSISANYESSDDGKDDSEAPVLVASNKSLNKHGQKTKFNKRNGSKDLRIPSRKNKSLLEMLLAPEIRKERNEILQCVRYIVKNNFFNSKYSDSSQ